MNRAKTNSNSTENLHEPSTDLPMKTSETGSVRPEPVLNAPDATKLNPETDLVRLEPYLADNRSEAPVPILTPSILWPFILLTSLFAWWGLANNMTDTLLPAFKRIMSFDDRMTAWIQFVCYMLGYGGFAIPGAIFMKRFSYKSGVLLGLGMFIAGTLLFFPAKFSSGMPSLCYLFYLGAILITFGGLAILETACNPYVCAMGDSRSAVRRLNLAQSFNPFGSLVGITVSQVFILSQLSPLSAEQRSALPVQELAAIQHRELSAISLVYALIGVILLATWLLIFFSKMPDLREENKTCGVHWFFQSWKRLLTNRNYVCAVIAQFCCVGASIGCWSFTVRYCMSALDLDTVASTAPDLLRSVEPVGAAFYRICDWIGFTGFIPKTAEQAGATFYVLSQILFIACRFACTGLMGVFKPSNLLIILACLAAACCLTTTLCPNLVGVYALIGVSGCLSLMFPTIFSYGTRDLGDDTKMGGAGLVAVLCGGAILTMIQGAISDATGQICYAYSVPMIAFIIIAGYAVFICRKLDHPKSGTIS